MGDDSSDSIPPELKVLMDLEITIKGMAAATDHQKLQSVLVDVPGVESVSFWEDTVGIRYCPETVTQHRLHELIVAAGFSIGDEDSARPTPSVDSH
jgi:hypothetical protein